MSATGDGSASASTATWTGPRSLSCARTPTGPSLQPGWQPFSTARPTGITWPWVAQDGQAVQIIVPVDTGKDGWDKAATAADELRAIAHDGSDGFPCTSRARWASPQTQATHSQGSAAPCCTRHWPWLSFCCCLLTGARPC